MFHLFQRLNSTLNKRGPFRVESKFIDKLLDMCHFHMLRLLLSAFLLDPFCPNLFESVVISSVVVEFLPSKIDYVGADCVEEISGMGNNYKGVGPGLEVILKPEGGVQIKMICRLIQQKHIWFRKKRPCQGDSHFPAT